MDIKERTEQLKPILPENMTDYDRLVASMHVWYPELKDESIPTPDTVFINTERITIREGTINEQPWAEYDIQEVVDAINSVDGPPAFIRTDQSSDKHNMARSSKLPTTDKETIKEHISELITANFNKGILGLPFSSFAVREWLDIKHSLVGWKNCPIGVELRAVINGGEVQEIHFYWDYEAVEQGLNNADKPIPEDYKQQYDQTKSIAKDNLDQVIPYIEQAASRFEQTLEEGWTIDFALTSNYNWYAIDMAPAAMSHIPQELLYEK